MDFSWTTIIITILLIIIVYFIWTMLSSSSTSTVISSSQDAKTQTSIPIPSTSNNYTLAFSTWIYVTDWNVTPDVKPIISSSTSVKTAGAATPPNLQISLGDKTNVLRVALNGGSSTTTIPDIPNIPLQTWVSIIVNVNNGISADIYINGKLVQTTALLNTWKLTAGTIYVGSPQSFDGFITMATYHNVPIGPQDAWDIYSSGYGSGGGSSVSDFFNKYKVRFAFVKDNVELSRLDI